MKRRINTDEKGSITREFTAWCGRCQEWDQIPAPNMSDAVRSFKRDGWENSRKDGWMCPRCVAEEKRLCES